MANLLDWNAAINAYRGGAPVVPEQEPVAVPEIAPAAPATPVVQPVVVPQAALPPAQVTNSRGAMAEMDAAAAAQGQAIQQQALAKAQQLQEQSALGAQQADMERAALDEQTARQDAFSAEREVLMSQYKDLNDQASRAQAIDSRSSGQKAMGILAVALGGLGDAFAKMGGNNSTDYSGRILSGIDAAVERDLQTQREAIQGKRAAAASKMTELGLARSFFQDDAQAMEFARASRKEMYAREMEAVATRSQIPAIQAQAQQAAAQAYAESAEKKAQLLASKENAAMSAAGRAAQGTGQLSVSEQIAIARLQRDQVLDRGRPEVAAQEKGAKLSEDLVVRDPEIAVVNAKSHEATQKGIDSAKKSVELIDAILEKRKGYTAGERAKNLVGMSDVQGELATLATALDLESKNVAELGALSGPDMGLIRGLVGDPESLTDAKSDAKLKALKASIIAGTNEKVRTRGFEAPLQAQGQPRQATKQAAAQAANAPQAASGMVRVKAPNGQTGSIPADKVEAALKAGYSRL
jgi:hypothetical protein